MSESENAVAVVTVPYTMNVPKESKEFVDLLVAVAEKAVSGASASSYLELLAELMAAADNAAQIPAELRSQYRDELAGYLVHRMMGTLLASKPEAPVVEPDQI